MDKTIQTIKYQSWTWHTSDPDLLKQVLQAFDCDNKKTLIKENDLRQVYTVTMEDGTVYYIKHDKPLKIRNKVKTHFFPKVRSEFRSAQLLHKYGVSTVEYLGWGRKGSEGLLVSCERRNSVNAKDYWFSECLVAGEARSRFLQSLTEFLTSFFKHALFHPDFHIGNLLYHPEQCAFYMVDPYGIKHKKCSPAQRFAMVRLIGAMRGELTDDQARDLLLAIGVESKSAQADQLWLQIKQAENDEMIKVWPKRKRQILTGNCKYCQTICYQEQPLVLRISQGGQCYLRRDKLEQLAQLPCRELAHDEAEQEWLESFRNDFLRKSHRMPVAWQKGADGNDKLYFQA